MSNAATSRRPLRTRAALGAALCALALLLGAGLSEAFEWRWLKRPLQAALQHSTGMPVRLDGDFRARLLRSPQLSVQRLTLPSPQFPGLSHLVDATELRMRWRWFDLWRTAFGAPLRLRSLEAATLDAQLVRDMAGHVSWRLSGPATTTDSAMLPRIGLLALGQGHIRWTDAPLATHIDFVLQGADGGSAPGYSAQATGLVRSLPLDLHIVVGGALPLLRDEADDRPAAAMPLRIEGKAGRSSVFFDGSADALFDAQRLSGEFRFAGPSLAAVGEPLGLTLPRTPAFELAGRLTHEAGVWSLATPQLHIGQSKLAGDFRYDMNPAVSRLSGQLRGSLLRLADLGPAVGTAGEGGSGGDLQARPGTRILPTREFDLPSLRDMNADVAVAIDTLDFGSRDIAPMQRLRTQLKLQDGRLQLTDLQAEVGGGRVSGTSGLDGSTDSARWHADLGFTGIDIARWLRALQKNGDAAAPATLSGELVARIKVAGHGRSTAQIIGSLDGQAQARLRHGTLSHLAVETAGLDLAQALGVMVRGDRALPLGCALLELQLHKGVMSVQRAVVDTTDSSLLMVGRIDLNDETLDLRVTVKPKDFSLFSLRAPVSVTGTLAQPVVAIEGKALAGRALVAAALAVVAPPAALLAFLDFGEPEAADPCARKPR
jgi:AsmA family protein